MYFILNRIVNMAALKSVKYFNFASWLHAHHTNTLYPQLTGEKEGLKGKEL